MTHKIWIFVLGVVALLIFLTLWPGIKLASLSNLVALGVAFLLADRAIYGYRSR